MSITGASLLLILLLGVTRHSFGAPLDSQVLERIRDLFRRMVFICDRDPELDVLTYDTLTAFADEYFGDPSEGRQVTIRGVQLLRKHQTLSVHILASRAYKQLAVFHSVFKDITVKWSPSHEENSQIKKNLHIIVRRLKSLKQHMAQVVFLSDQSPRNSSRYQFPKVPQPNRIIWTKSSDQQKDWILGVLNRLDVSLIYLTSAFRMRAKHVQ